jgi:hypothetical protein
MKTNTRITIDMNKRVRGDQTVSGFEDVVGPMQVNSDVTVSERESSLVGTATITEVDISNQLVYLRVDWNSLRPEGPFEF